MYVCECVCTQEAPCPGQDGKNGQVLPLPVPAAFERHLSAETTRWSRPVSLFYSFEDYLCWRMPKKLLPLVPGRGKGGGGRQLEEEE